MKKKDVTVGKVYLAKVSNVLCPVRVDSFTDGGSRRSQYKGTNLRTGRAISFSAAKLRRELRDEEVAAYSRK